MARAKNKRADDKRAGDRRVAVSAVVESVDGGLAELMPDRDRGRAWTLLIDGAPQSHVDLDDPSYLSFEYQRRLGHVIDLVAPPGKPAQVVHLGGGAFTLARYVAATRPRSTQQVVERDAALVQLVRRELPLDPNARIRVRSVDAREGLAKVPDGWADLVIADVFSGARTPAHLTSGEFLTDVRRVVNAGGLYAANLADGPPLAHLRGQIATAAGVFPELALIADPAVLRGKRFGNAVLVGSALPLPVRELTRRAASDPHPARVEHGKVLRDFTGGATPVTDAAAVASPAPPPSVFR
ncbi:spermidine synthase [Streptomyces sp. NBC_00878]|uniref:spermidine synthase n=1 Tax=Streptomyces sp. NBC_00878 TaxID=2975854 RepID=UPI00225B0EAE|nr:fused MFS/spermidine synthase [Streptomyces sp. NBC_00878]MCX4908459.1 fused MFS/spermidine synthase [Streptomyces sp. NBC_00878]